MKGQSAVGLSCHRSTASPGGDRCQHEAQDIGGIIMLFHGLLFTADRRLNII